MATIPREMSIRPAAQYLSSAPTERADHVLANGISPYFCESAASNQNPKTAPHFCDAIALLRSSLSGIPKFVARITPNLAPAEAMEWQDA